MSLSDTLWVLLGGFATIDWILFLCLMVYKSSWVIQFQSHPYRRTVVILLNVGDKRLLVFPKGICLKVNLIAWPEFKLTYFNTTVQHFSHYTRWTLPTNSWSMTSVSIALGLTDLAWLSSFLWPKLNFLNYLVIVLW